mgnify:CR=1 FL=1|jgi:hypothetical protein
MRITRKKLSKLIKEELKDAISLFEDTESEPTIIPGISRLPDSTTGDSERTRPILGKEQEWLDQYGEYIIDSIARQIWASVFGPMTDSELLRASLNVIEIAMRSDPGVSKKIASHYYNSNMGRRQNTLYDDILGDFDMPWEKDDRKMIINRLEDLGIYRDTGRS